MYLEPYRGNFSMPQPFVLFDNVCKYYQMGETRIAASDHVSFEIEKG